MKKLISLKPKKIDEDTWFYVEQRGITIVYKQKQIFIDWRRLIKY